MENRLEWAAQWLKLPKQMYAGAEWIPGSGDHFISTNPANGTPLCGFREASPRDVEDMGNLADHAFRKGPWRSFPRRERARCLQKIAELIRHHRAELATLESLANGKTFKESYNDDLPEAADVFDYYAGWTDKLYAESIPVDGDFVNFTAREPVGACGLIVPWNFPLLLAAWKIAPALAMGNTVIVKPAPFTSLSALRLAEIVHESGILPPGVLNVVLGGATAGEAICRHPRIAKVSFTGSTRVGSDILRASADSNLKTVTLELGGKSPNIIFADAPDLEAALRRTATAMFSHKGEKCSEPTRLLLHRTIYDRAIAQLETIVNGIVVGDPFDPATGQGAQCHLAHFEKIMSYIEIGKQEGARLVAGGSRDSRDKNARGYFIRPTLFAEVSKEMRIAREEIFGPVLSILPFSDEDEAIEIANDTPYGLAAGVYTSDSARAHRVARQLDAGMVFVNHYGCYDFASPFGGFKQSGWGKEMGRHSLEAYTRLKSIWIKH